LDSIGKADKINSSVHKNIAKLATKNASELAVNSASSIAIASAYQQTWNINPETESIASEDSLAFWDEYYEKLEHQVCFFISTSL